MYLGVGLVRVGGSDLDVCCDYRPGGFGDLLSLVVVGSASARVCLDDSLPMAATRR